MTRRSLLLLALIAATPAKADVFEFGVDGVIIVHGATLDKAATRPSSARAPFPARVALRRMTETTALRHAAAPGVRAAGLDALAFTRLFTALIDQESRFNPVAVSPKGAMGLGQLMPATAAALGVADAFDPAANLDGAARYFTAQLARFGSVPFALAAYNAGPHRVVEYGGVPPFVETRAYVANIAAAAGLDARAVASDAPRAVAAAPAAIPIETEPKAALIKRTPSVWEF